MYGKQFMKKIMKAMAVVGLLVGLAVFTTGCTTCGGCSIDSGTHTEV